MHIICYLICLFLPTSAFAKHIYVDYLLWSGHQDGLEFAETGIANTPVYYLDQGKVYQPACRFDSGIRVGLVWATDYCWDLHARYTFFQTHQTGHVEKVNNLEPLWFTDNINVVMDSAKGDWKLQVNAIDLVMSQCYYLGSCFQLTPYYGIKATWNVFHYDIAYTHDTDPEVSTRDEIRNLMEIYGAGPRVGLRTDWLLPCGFCFVSEISASCIFSDFWCRREDEQFLVNPETGEIFPTDSFGLGTTSTDTYGKQSYSSCCLIPVIELSLGVAYNCPFSCGKVGVLYVGWEEQVWLYADHFIRVKRDQQSSHGSLFLQGLVVRGELQF